MSKTIQLFAGINDKYKQMTVNTTGNQSACGEIDAGTNETVIALNGITDPDVVYFENRNASGNDYVIVTLESGATAGIRLYPGDSFSLRVDSNSTPRVKSNANTVPVYYEVHER